MIRGAEWPESTEHPVGSPHWNKRVFIALDMSCNKYNSDEERKLWSDVVRRMSEREKSVGGSAGR